MIELYIDYLSQPSRAVLIYSLTNQLPIQIHHIQIGLRQNRAPQYVKINPFKRVPAISIGNFSLAESHSIIRFLHQKYKPHDDKLMPDRKSQPLLAAQVDMYLDWHLTNTRRCGNWLFYEIFSKFLNYKIPYNHEKIYTEMKQALTYIDQIYLKEDSPFLLGQNYTIADVVAYCEIIQLQLAEFDFTPYRRLTAWMGRVAKLPHIKEAHQHFEEFKKSMLGQKDKAKL